jgi:hypothetical protein
MPFLHCVLDENVFLAQNIEGLIKEVSFRTIDSAGIQYEAYCDDFGPMSMASTRCPRRPSPSHFKFPVAGLPPASLSFSSYCRIRLGVTESDLTLYTAKMILVKFQAADNSDSSLDP